MLTSELPGFIAWALAASRYPLGTTVAVMVGGLMVMSLIGRVTLGHWFASWRIFVIGIIFGSSVLLLLLINPPRVVAIAVYMLMTVLWVYFRLRYRRDP
jgi:hypothetical protein